VTPNEPSGGGDGGPHAAGPTGFSVPTQTGGGQQRPLDVLKRLTRPQPRQQPGERCEMCGEGISEEHSHVVNVASRNLLCVCRACYLLFTHAGAARGKYRAVPDRYVYDPSFHMSDVQWEAIQIPVKMAFFFYNSSMDRVVGFYPSPAGATESLLPLQTWEDIMKANPLFATLTPDVEALLINRGGAGFECFLVPIDAAYELVGLVRRHWKGFDGGEEAWREIDRYFFGLRERSRKVYAGEPHE
jgi:hypothetical protein